MVETATCWHCGGQNTTAQRFCGSCGASLTHSCPACDERYQPGSSFCGSCGVDLRALSTPADSPELEMEERRWMTIVFADLSGFTGLAERSDPEDVRSMVDRCMCLLGDVVRRFGGTVHQIAGDAMLAVFGAPAAHEDDAERAVRAALEMQGRARERAADFGGLSLRIGVNTGEVMVAPVGPKGRREQAVVGDVVNTAARLQTSAPTSAILVGEETWRATHSSIHYEPMEPFWAKNKSKPVSAWLAIGCSLTPSERPISAAPMVGRDMELHLLRNLWQEAVAEGQSYFVIVRGPAGIGKSRLCREFRTIVEHGEGRFMRGRSLPYGENTAYGAFAQIIKKSADIFETDSVECGRAKLARRVAELVSESEADSVTAHLALIVGLGNGNLVTDRQVLFSSAARFVESLAVEKPTVFCFEDVHWAEPSLVDLVKFLAVGVRQAPTFFLMSTRGEPDGRADWEGGELPCTTVSLEALPEPAAEELSMQLLGTSYQRSSVAERLRVAAGGNPLFIEELAASLVRGTVDSGQALPTNLKALIAARLDSLPAEQRRVVLDASVVGDAFWQGAIAALRSHTMLDAALQLLEAQGLIQREKDSRLEGDIEFSFKHTVIREVAYGILAKSHRRERHTVVAKFIEDAQGARTAENVQFLAYHWRHSIDPHRAIDYLVAAAEQAGRGWAKQEAVTLYNEALELTPEDDPRRRIIAVKRAVAFQGWLHRSLDLDPGALGGLAAD